MLNLVSNLTATTTAATLSTADFVLYVLVSLGLGALIALAFRFKNKSTKGFTTTLALLPAIVCVVIMLVNGNLGTGVAVMGAFSLVRFRSVPGNARDICSIFLAMAVGLATGTGYIAIAVIFALIICAVNIFYTALPFGESKGAKQLTITIPESLDYSEIFDDLFEQFTSYHDLVCVKTTNMGSLFKVTYEIKMKNSASEKAFIDEIRTRNGNLEITCGRVITNSSEQL